MTRFLKKLYLAATNAVHGSQTDFHVIYRVGQKVRPQTHDHNSAKPYPFTIFFTGRFIGKFAVNWLFKIPPLLAYVATLSCETLMSENKQLMVNLQVSVAIYVRCGRVVHN